MEFEKLINVVFASLVKNEVVKQTNFIFITKVFHGEARFDVQYRKGRFSSCFDSTTGKFYVQG